MTEEQRRRAEGMLASIRETLRAMASLSREEFMSSDETQWRIMQAIVTVGLGADTLFWLIVQYPDPWWWRASRLAFGLKGGNSRLDPKYLWVAIPRDWPRLERKLRQLLDDDPSPVPHGWTEE